MLRLSLELQQLHLERLVLGLDLQQTILKRPALLRNMLRNGAKFVTQLPRMLQIELRMLRLTLQRLRLGLRLLRIGPESQHLFRLGGRLRPFRSILKKGDP